VALTAGGLASSPATSASAATRADSPRRSKPKTPSPQAR
jgi:hypothetical protein